MIVFDPLYGRFEVPAYLTPLVLTPEVRRLSQVRFLNTMTPSLATLGELRRYSHTLGVLFLCGQLGLTDYAADEVKALAASVLLHDIGTPPFGHLFEYHLKESSGWTHEGIIKDILWGAHAPENRAHQIFAGRTIKFRTALKSSGIALDLVENIVSNKHPLSSLLFGTIDLDNLDNVARMGWALGLSGGGQVATRLASTLGVDRSSVLRLPVTERETICKWTRLRSEVYEILVFDPPTAAAQAVLSEAIETGIKHGTLSEDDWCLSDEQLLERLRLDPTTKDTVSIEYLGQLPEMVCAIQLKGNLPDFHLSDRAQAKELIENVFGDVMGEPRVLGYVFVDSGTFAKCLSFRDPRTEAGWTEGVSSTSIVLYAFVRSRRRPSAARTRSAADRLMERLGCSQDQVLRCKIAPFAESVDGQRSLDFPT
jgi:HD superfamily phosphohydrolase